jgi:hypothetical protein
MHYAMHYGIRHYASGKYALSFCRLTTHIPGRKKEKKKKRKRKRKRKEKLKKI